MTEIFDSGDDDEDTVDTSDHSPLREKGESVKGFCDIFPGSEMWKFFNTQYGAL